MLRAVRCLNPYSNGMWIEHGYLNEGDLFTSLNPYSNGMWIEQQTFYPLKNIFVLILILMECG